MEPNTSSPIVFLDTSVLLTSFATYHAKGKLPPYMTDESATRYTFEKCVFEVYMAFRGVGGKKPDEGRQDWAIRHLKGDNDPYWLDKLAGRFHGSDHVMAHYWINNIIGIDLASYAKNANDFVEPGHQEDAFKEIEKLVALGTQRSRYEALCDEFLQMLEQTNVTIAPYISIFQSDNNLTNVNSV